MSFATGNAAAFPVYRLKDGSSRKAELLGLKSVKVSHILKPPGGEFLYREVRMNIQDCSNAGCPGISQASPLSSGMNRGGQKETIGNASEHVR